eukprot:508507_1
MTFYHCSSSVVYFGEFHAYFSYPMSTTASLSVINTRNAQEDGLRIRRRSTLHRLLRTYWYYNYCGSDWAVWWSFVFPWCAFWAICGGPLVSIWQFLVSSFSAYYAVICRMNHMVLLTPLSVRAPTATTHNHPTIIQ